MNALRMPAGPSSVPSAANSFTSPAPVAPITWPGSSSSSPHRPPRSADAIPSVVTWNSASARPVSARPPVSTFGTRRTFKSTAAPAPPPAVTSDTTTGSEILSNGLPEHRVDRIADRRHAREDEDGDEHGQQAVLDQVLAFVVAHEISNGGDHTGHDVL